MPDGRLFPSPGIVVSARPKPKAPTIMAPEAPRLLQEPTGRVRIDWIEPERRIGTNPPDAESPPHVGRYASHRHRDPAARGSWIEPSAPDRAYDFDPPRSGLCHYTPILEWADACVVGHGAVLTRVPDPTDLARPAPAADSARPPAAAPGHAPVAMARGSHGRADRRRSECPPQGPSDPLAITTNLTRADYERQDCWTFSLPTSTPRGSSSPSPARGSNGFAVVPSPTEGGPWSLRVFSVAEWDGVRSLSPGLEPSAITILPGPHPEVTVSYSLKRSWLPGLPWSLTFFTEPTDSVLPPMVVVAHPRTVPLSVDDGEIVARLPGVRNRARFSIPNLAGQGVRVFSDPSVPPDAQVPIRFRHPETGSTRV